jgi:hypothetical protein
VQRRRSYTDYGPPRETSVCAYAFRVAFVRDENNVVHPTKHNAKREVECVAAMNI